MTPATAGRFSSTNFVRRLVPAAIRRLGNLGIKIEPFLIVREAESSTLRPSKVSGVTFRLANSRDIDQLLPLQETHTRESLGAWFLDNKLCFVAQVKGNIAAVTWCDLTTFNYAPNHRLLGDKEAYLFAAYSDPEFRGRNIAPSLRAFCYETLRKMGKSRLYSYTDYYNSAGRRFKTKLAARDVALRLSVDLWGYYQHTFTLRSYDRQDYPGRSTSRPGTTRVNSNV